MKKLLGMLGTITIAGSGMSGIVANAPAPASAKNEINDLKTKNLKKLNRVKRWNVNKLQNKGDYLRVHISHNTWQNIAFQHDVINNYQEFENWLFGTINNFYEDEYGKSVTSSNRLIMVKIIAANYQEINDLFLGKNNNNLGLIVKTDTNSKWARPGESYWNTYYGVTLDQ